MWLSAPLTPLIVSVRVPRESLVELFIVSTDVVAVPAIGFTLKVAVSFVVWPVTLSVMPPVKPLVRPIVTVYVVDDPRVTERLEGETAIGEVRRGHGDRHRGGVRQQPAGRGDEDRVRAG